MWNTSANNNNDSRPIPVKNLTTDRQSNGINYITYHFTVSPQFGSPILCSPGLHAQSSIIRDYSEVPTTQLDSYRSFYRCVSIALVDLQRSRRLCAENRSLAKCKCFPVFQGVCFFLVLFRPLPTPQPGSTVLAIYRNLSVTLSF